MGSIPQTTDLDKQHLNGMKVAAQSHASDRARFDFQKNWFEWLCPEWEERTRSIRGKKLRIMEIGSFEGSSTTWILDNLMSHPESTMVAIDTFAGSMEHHEDHDASDTFGLLSLEDRFRANVSKCEAFDKLTVMKMHSDDALIALRRERCEFDFIYIDASHVAVDVLHDAVLCWRMLSPSGFMVFDDFSWKGYMEDCYNPRIAIEGFLRCVEPEVEYEETEWQMWARRVSPKSKPTANPDPNLYYGSRGVAKKP